MSETHPPRSIGRSIGAVLAGIAVGVILSLGTDSALRAAGIFSPLGHQPPMSDSLFLLASAYRIVYGVVGSYIIARLAPNRPMRHALIGGALGLIVSIVGAVATWNHEPPLGPHWYSLALAVTALPCAWLGGKLGLIQNAASS
jgi:uncharacterized membrane protein YccC